MELRHLRDPLQLADHVRDMLRNKNEKKALELVRAASKDVDCTVAWNHLMDYGMSKGMVNPALKYYNEVGLGTWLTAGERRLMTGVCCR